MPSPHRQETKVLATSDQLSSLVYLLLHGLVSVEGEKRVIVDEDPHRELYIEQVGEKEFRVTLMDSSSMVN